MPVRAIDLFCGGGGSSCGAQLAGVRIIGAADACPIATATYADNFPSASRNIVTRRLASGCGADVFTKLGKVDLVLASPECTNHSVARGSRPICEASRRSAWLVLPFLEELRPRWVVLENVGGITRWEGFISFRQALEREGYHLRIHRLDSADHGVPQQRRRVFIVGDRERKPRPIEIASGRQPAAVIIDRRTNWKSSPLFKLGRAQATQERAKAAIRALGEGVEFLLVYYGSDKGGGWQTLDRPLRTLTTLDRFGFVQWNAAGDPTLRMLQVPELKAAMGLPDRYKLNHGTRRDKVRLLGNGVSPPVMRSVVESLIGVGSNLDYSDPDVRKLPLQPRSRRRLDCPSAGLATRPDQHRTGPDTAR